VSLRARLGVVLGALFLVPLLVGGLVIALVLPGIRATRISNSLERSGMAVRAEIHDECRFLGVAARGVALDAGATDPRQAARAAVRAGYADYAALLGPSGRVVASAGTMPAGSGTADSSVACSRSTDATVLAEHVSVSGVPGVRTTVLIEAVGTRLLQSLRSRSGVGGDVVLAHGDHVVASTADPATTQVVLQAVAGQHGTVTSHGWLMSATPARPGAPFRVVVTERTPSISSDTLLLLVVIVVSSATAAALLVAVVARGLSQPFSDLTEAAERVARGDLEASLTRPADGEAKRLSDAFNRMTGELRRNMTALEQSRGDLRESLERIGDTLSSTHDLDGLLQVVLETAVVTLQSQAGVVLYGAPDQLRVVAENGLHEAGLSAPVAIAPGVGVLGRVVASGEAVRGRLSSGPEELNPAPTEPRDGQILAVPLRSMGAVLGVLALYGRLDDRAYDPADEDALRTLAGQAGIAIDNVQLHQEAERLSTTDALTGLWNFRYLSMSLAREIERSTRFERPLAVLMLDLDNFKAVNDERGHAVGDAVLRELAHRVQEQIREVDTFARYGGEEFVVVLPETTVEGATQLAERICSAVRRDPFDVEGGPLRVTVSVGGAAFPTQGSSAATLMRAADKALYVAKHEGRDRWHVPAQ
jgi:diguanylate cyclase (GGDEF)-like protein